MQFELEDIKPEHFDEIIGQPSQNYFKELLKANPKYKDIVCHSSIGKAGRLDGVIIGICGITQITDYLGEGWAYFSEDLPRTSIQVVKAIRSFLKEQKHLRRIQCTVDAYNYQAIRFAEVVGFKPEAILKSFGPEGHDHIMFTIINRSLDWETR